jgi:hypothetical protein
VNGRSQVARPTEHAAIRAASRSARPLPPVEVLFAHLVVAHAMNDRHGANLFGHAIARSSGDLDY